MSSAEIVTVRGVDVPAAFYKGERVVTLSMIDRVHGRPDGTARRAFNDNRSRFVSDEDFFELTSNEIRAMSEQGIFPARTARGSVITRRGYLKLVKTLNDDTAWTVFDDMIDRYFAAPRVPTTAEALAQSFTMLAAQERRQIEHEKAIGRLEQKVDRVATAQTVLSSRPSNAESITHIRERIGKRHGLSSTIVDAVMRQSTYAPKPAGMVRNDHADADGSTYAVYWKKDVTATFDRFVSECTAVTATMFTHPFIEGRFRIGKLAKAA